MVVSEADEYGPGGEYESGPNTEYDRPAEDPALEKISHAKKLAQTWEAVSEAIEQDDMPPEALAALSDAAMTIGTGLRVKAIMAGWQPDDEDDDDEIGDSEREFSFYTEDDDDADS